MNASDVLAELMLAELTPGLARRLPNGEILGVDREMYRSFIWVGDQTGWRLAWFYEQFRDAQDDFNNPYWDPRWHNPPGNWFRRVTDGASHWAANQGKSTSIRRLPIYGQPRILGCRPSGWLEFERW